jgi:hypothetical protein
MIKLAGGNARDLRKLYIVLSLAVAQYHGPEPKRARAVAIVQGRRRCVQRERQIMREDFSATDVMVAVLTAAVVSGIFTSPGVPAAEFPTSASANACAQWNLSAADFNECQSLWSTARTSAERKEIEKRFQARGMVIPGSRRAPVGGPGNSDTAVRPGNSAGAGNAAPAPTTPTAGGTGSPGNLSASPPK